MLTSSWPRRLILLIVPLVTTSSCSDGAGPRRDMIAVAGTYVAHADDAPVAGRLGVFTTTAGGVTTDMLEAGAFIRLILHATGVTDGHLSIPDEMDESLAGTWTLNGDVVRLSHGGDTFLRDMVLRVRDGRLEGEEVFAGVTVRVVLERSP